MNKLFPALLITIASTLLGACDNAPSTSVPITGNHPTAPKPVVAADTTVSTPPAGGAAPFVNPTKAGRVLGSQSPSPPESRTR
jgi:hypothetical protein